MPPKLMMNEKLLNNISITARREVALLAVFILRINISCCHNERNGMNAVGEVSEWRQLDISSSSSSASFNPSDHP